MILKIDRALAPVKRARGARISLRLLDFRGITEARIYRPEIEFRGSGLIIGHSIAM